MSDLTPTRSLLIALAEERRTMREGYAFLDEKCLLLAGEMLRQVRAHQALARELAVLQRDSAAALAAALARHGLHGLAGLPARRRAGADPDRLSPSAWGDHVAGAGDRANAARHRPPSFHRPRPKPAAPPIDAWPTGWQRWQRYRRHSRDCYAEYRRTVRRVRALQDVLLAGTRRRHRRHRHPPGRPRARRRDRRAIRPLSRPAGLR